ncbi:SusC/RagA family TonB-linked outer membrane protein [Pollutibacter soli]|uniref:SusC/RagA family TonB-linked outer membrane protein n=1 Tax=Pollutibacter soli TaxID=3034157 RepID=UPI0030132368
MKISILLVLGILFQMSTKCYSQNITLSLDNVPIQKVFRAIEKQSAYSFVYGKDQIAEIGRVTLHVEQAGITETLNQLFKERPLSYSIVGNYISVRKVKLIIDPSEAKPTIDPAIFSTGRIVSDNGEPIAAITVSVKNTNISTKSSDDGRFKIDLPKQTSVLIFTGVGFQTKEMDIQAGKDLGDVMLNIMDLSLNEVIVTGYSAQKRKDVTAAVSIVNVADLKAVPSANATSQLQGRSSGVTVTLNGTPGVAAKVRIRGLGSFQNNNPLYVVDGVQTFDISNLNPNDIESLQVLKDPASASIYGVRSSNGVIVITTKRNTKGVMVSYDMNYGIQFPGSGFEKTTLSPMEDAQLARLVLRNEGKSLDGSIYGNGPEPVLPDYIFAGNYQSASGVPGPLFEGNPAVDPSLYSLNPKRVGDPGYSAYIIVPANKEGTNWWKESTRNAPIQNHNLSFGSGNEKSFYLLSLNYFNQQAITEYQFYKRYNARINSKFTLFDKIHIGENLQVYFSESNVQGNSASGNKSNNQEEADISGTWSLMSIVPVYNTGGDWAGSRGDWGGKNPLALLYRKKDNRDNSHGLFGNIYGEVDLFRDFNVRTSFGGTINNRTQYSYPINEYENSLNQNSPTYSENYIKTNYWIWTNHLTYKKSIGKHEIDALAGYEASKSGGRQIIGTASNFYSYTDIPYINLGTGTTPNLRGSGPFAEVTTASMFFSVNYKFNDKYLFSALVRRDGSSKFVGDEIYATFPALSGGWRISAEKFMKNIQWINDLKLRASWGISGNEAALGSINGYTTYISSAGSSFYDIYGTNNSPASGFYLNFVGNPKGRWEQNQTINAGFDATLFNNAVSICFDIYQKETRGLLYNPIGQGILGAAGYNPAFKNVGSMRNRGIDLLLSNNTHIGKNFSLQTTLTFTTYKNKILSITEGLPYFDFNSPSNESNRLNGQTITRNIAGYPMNTYYGYKVIGIFQSQAQVDAAPPQYSGGTTNTAFPGSFIFEDISGPAGKPDGVIDSWDRTVIGDPNPDFNVGLNISLEYKAFDLVAFFYCVAGKENYNWSKWFRDFTNNFSGGKSKDALYNSWLPDGSRPDARVPIQLSTGSFSTSQTVNSYFVENASYFRLRNLQLGYTLQGAWMKKFHITKARIYLQGTNIFTITKYSGLDPEVISNDDRAAGIDLGTYPTVRQFSFGASVKF